MNPDLAWNAHMAENLLTSTLRAMNDLISEMESTIEELEEQAEEADAAAEEQREIQRTAMKDVYVGDGLYVSVNDNEARNEAREKAVEYEAEAAALREDIETIRGAIERLRYARGRTISIYNRLQDALTTEDGFSEFRMNELVDEITRYIGSMARIRDSFNDSFPLNNQQAWESNLNEVLYKAVSGLYLSARFSGESCRLMTAFAGDPINMATGNFVYNEDDLVRVFDLLLEETPQRGKQGQGGNNNNQ